MKIGILTFHTALNYGAVLQAYASVRFLKSRGHEVFVVDYRNRGVSRYFSPFYWDNNRLKKEGVRYVAKYPFMVCSRLKKTREFYRFITDNLPLCSCREAEGLDLLFVGSDQIWNKQLTDGKDPVYYGEEFPSVRKVTWAASAGKVMPDNDDIQSLIRRFEFISVREQSLADRIPHSVLLPDPTLMLSHQEWKKLVHPVTGRYLLAYPMAHVEEVMEVANRKAQEMGVSVKVISPVIKLGSNWIQTASPEDFISLIFSAEYVVTSSFHGAVFSLVFERPHTFVFHNDPRFDTLLSSDLSAASEKGDSFINFVLGTHTQA